jgi:hypothetical protein
MSLVRDQQPVRTLGPHGPKRTLPRSHSPPSSEQACARFACPAPETPPRNWPVNLASLSRSKNRPEPTANRHATCRAWWVTHFPCGCAVQLAKYTRRPAISMKSSAYSRWNQSCRPLRNPRRRHSSLARGEIHATRNQSACRLEPRCARLRTFRTVAAENEYPFPSHSRTMRT